MILWLLTQAWALDLETARSRATQEALAVEVARAERDGARRDAAVAIGAALPAITAYASAGTGAGQTAFGFERPVTSLYAAGVRGTWTLISPATWAAAAAARRTTRGREALLDWAEVQAREAATAGYATAWGALRTEQALASAVDDATRGEEATGARVGAGLATEADLSRATAERTAVEARLAQARGATIAACASLQSLLGDDITGSCTLEPPSWHTPGAPVAHHPALTASREALAATRGSQVAAWLALAPSVTVTGLVATYKAGEGAWGPGWQASAQVDLPLLDIPTVAGARSDDAAVQAARWELEARRRDLAVAAVAAEAEHTAAQQALIAQQRAVEAAEQAFAQVDARTRQGLEGLDAWLDARRALEEARTGAARAEAALGAALGALEAARGVRESGR